MKRDPVARRPVRVGYLAGAAAAVTFGASAPLAKHSGENLDAQLVAGLLYAGAFLAIAPVAAARRRSTREASLQRSDRGPLVGLVVLGGIIAPVLLMAGLQRVSGVSGSLLLNLEGPFTLVVGVVAFGEHLGRRSAVAAALVLGGAFVLTAAGGPFGDADTVGALLIVAACAAWAIDNNLTQTLTVRDPFAIVAVKTGIAATVNVVIAAMRGASWPSGSRLAALVAIGAVGYGISVVADAYALRLLGAARESAVFAVAPFAGALVAFVVLGDRLSAFDVVAGALMATGLVAMITDRHGHQHHHDPLEHEHRHRHDEHHRHSHPPGSPDPADGIHSHQHRHEPLTHIHEHVSDVHHRHAHAHVGRDPASPDGEREPYAEETLEPHGAARPGHRTPRTSRDRERLPGWATRRATRRARR